ncbi:nuclear transport factor 2 family protein [Chitinophaga sancti]|uniref:Nuclear transport factor 2 family protein n=1 Tax=Chitinophaga sancti TaxID=1004 RepID=A0A1K1SNA0_9BACT|nr:nuclear transport factor 2 family protein [Chitinophaga sancti]WQD60066.1 nuclear transport factor 2 family protein [Chitinophaga sancti]WQG87805.1 nuclear transport factor 2 family protein [Chitinophaga sancti]SFW85770.1 SnoaL-like domain-containing protein [Chitinophaga sancti]
MEQAIIQAITTLFAGADERNWRKVKEVMGETVLLDYSSMNGNAASSLTPLQIAGSWAAFLPGFDKTHHQLSDFKVAKNDTVATVNFSGKATHWIGNDSWVVEGTYDVKLLLQNDQWLIAVMKFNFEKQSGHTGLPALATERAKMR